MIIFKSLGILEVDKCACTLDVEDCSEELLCQQSYAIKNSLVLYGKRAPLIDPFPE